MAIVDTSDVNHSAALAYQGEIIGTCRLVVTSYILDELYTLTLMDLGYRHVVEVKQKLDRLSDDSLLDIAWVDKALADEGWNVFERFNRLQLASRYYAANAGCGVSPYRNFCSCSIR